MTSKYSARFQNLLLQSDEVARTKTVFESEYSGTTINVDAGQFLAWCVKCRSLLSLACGENSEHYRQFVHSEKSSGWSGNFHTFELLKAVLEAAEEDFNGGFLRPLRSLVQAEVLIDELEQAKTLLSSGYSSPAAVVAGVVLETKLREMCQAHDLSSGKIDKMNADLVKAQAYNLAVQKRITAIADIRNNAAHKHPDRFKSEDVDDMISYIERFIADYPYSLNRLTFRP